MLATILTLGVYWPGEYLQTNPDKSVNWAAVETSIGDLAAHNVNAVWLTHRNAADTARFARIADKYGVKVVASLYNLDCKEPTVVNNFNAANTVARIRTEWGDAPKPLAWGIGDEPYSTGCVSRFQAAFGDEPTTAVLMHNQVALHPNMPWRTVNVYPFFSEGNPNRYAGRAWAAWINNVRRVPWAMGQSFQEPWGPYTLEAGNIVYQPGGAPHWVYPSPAEMRWQALTALAVGSKGMFFFAYRWPIFQRRFRFLRTLVVPKV